MGDGTAVADTAPSPAGLDTGAAQARLLDLLPDDDAEEASAGTQGEGESPDAEAEEQPVAEQEGEPEAGAEDDDLLDAMEQDEEAPPAEPETYEVTVDGKPQRVTLSEALNDFSGRQALQRRFTELDLEKKSLASERDGLRTEREHYGQQLKVLNQLLESGAGAEPDWDRVRQEDPEGYAAAYADWQRGAETRRRLLDEQKRIEAENAEAARKERDGLIKAEREALASALGWTSPDTALAGAQKIREYGNSIGLTNEVLDGTTNHVAMVVLDKARRYDELVARRRQVAAKAAAANGGVKPLKPGSEAAPKPRSKTLDRAQKRLKESGRVKDAAALLETML